MVVVGGGGLLWLQRCPRHVPQLLLTTSTSSSASFTTIEEVGAGVVIPSIWTTAEWAAAAAEEVVAGLVRVDCPSAGECDAMELQHCCAHDYFQIPSVEHCCPAAQAAAVAALTASPLAAAAAAAPSPPSPPASHHLPMQGAPWP